MTKKKAPVAKERTYRELGTDIIAELGALVTEHRRAVRKFEAENAALIKERDQIHKERDQMIWMHQVTKDAEGLMSQLARTYYMDRDGRPNRILRQLKEALATWQK